MTSTGSPPTGVKIPIKASPIFCPINEADSLTSMATNFPIPSGISRGFPISAFRLYTIPEAFTKKASWISSLEKVCVSARSGAISP